MKLKVTTPDGQDVEIEARSQWTVMEAIRDAGLPILAQCGGGKACATCHVHVAPQCRAALPAMDEEERELLSESEHYDAAASRLACQIVFTPALDGLAVVLQPDAWER